MWRFDRQPSQSVAAPPSHTRPSAGTCVKLFWVLPPAHPPARHRKWPPLMLRRRKNQPSPVQTQGLLNVADGVKRLLLKPLSWGQSLTPH